ncbi:MAG: nitrogenase [Thermodesulfobacteria bacterium]|nr:nitrogenase [Thermodesulfobacteriota bacterium]
MSVCGAYGCVPLAAKPCGLLTEPGGMSQRSCAYFGARYVLGPVKEALHLVHGPVGCLSYGQMVRGQREPLLGTATGEAEIIFGGLARLRRALYEGLSLFPEVRGAFLYATCATGLTGEDLSTVAREVEEETKKRVLVLDCPGFSHPTQAGGHALAYRALSSLVREGERAAAPVVNLVGEYNVAGEAEEIVRLLAALGVRVHTVLTGKTRLSEIETLTRARLNLLFCGSTARDFAEDLKSRFGMPWIKVSFYGLSATSASLRKVAEALGLSGSAVEELIAREEAGVREWLRPRLPLFSGKRALLVLGAGRVGPLARLLRELGFEVVGAASIFGTPRDHEEAAPYSGFLTDDPGDDEVERLLSLLKPDLVLTNAREVWRVIKFGFPALSFPQEKRRGGYAGYRGLLNLARDIERVLTAPVFRLPPLV